MVQQRVIGAALTALHVSRAGALMSRLTRGIGAILTLHHVRPEPPSAFAPNRILSITPDFLAQAIEHVLGAGYDIVDLDEVARRLARGDQSRPFCCFTFDDGYRDNRDFALPVFERYGLPMAIYVTADFADHRGDLWWLALEEAVRRLEHVDLELQGRRQTLPSRTDREKSTAYSAIYWWLRGMPEAEARTVVARLCREAGYDASPLSARLCMGWDELRELAVHPLVTLGAHTLGHWALAKLPEEEARRQVVESIARLAAETGRPCRHFSFPYGDAASAGPREFAIATEAGMRTAVTTQKSLVQTMHRSQTTGLPRLSLNGDYQDIGHFETLLTGAPFALLDMARRFGRLTARAAASTI